jgi:hypothetical protein
VRIERIPGNDTRADKRNAKQYLLGEPQPVGARYLDTWRIGKRAVREFRGALWRRRRHMPLTTPSARRELSGMRCTKPIDEPSFLWVSSNASLSSAMARNMASPLDMPRAQAIIVNASSISEDIVTVMLLFMAHLRSKKKLYCAVSVRPFDASQTDQGVTRK